jgi:TonB-dependent SusC/RagA subfamily outer membrane receptor
LSTSFGLPRRRRAARATPRPPAASRATPLAAALALALLPGALLVPAARTLHAQPAAAQGTGRIAGTVLGEGARPVAGAQVIVVGTRVGAVTDDNGRYNIGGAPVGAQTVRVQRIGFTPRTQPVTVAAGQVATLDFQLAAAATQLTAVAVVGYTNEARRDISGAVASVSGAELQDQKVATIEEALRGRAPGVQIAASGQPGRPAQIIIRGQNGFNSPTPLYVVDGNYIGQQNPNLNPDDIASIEILKDASAAAQYGAQASNGVVVITTRRGQSGPSQFSFSTYYGFQQVPKRLDLASSSELTNVFTQAFANANITDTTRIPLIVRRPSAVSAANTDWQDAVFQTGALQNYNLQASGGTPTANYLLSGSVLDQNGTIINTGFTRYSVRVNSEARRGRFTVGEAIALSQARQTDFGNGVFGGQALPLIDLATLPSAVPVRDANNPGGYGFGSDAVPAFQVNPVAVLERNSNRRRSNQVIGTGYGEVRLFGGLRYRANLGLTYADSLATVYTSATQVATARRSCRGAGAAGQHPVPGHAHRHQPALGEPAQLRRRLRQRRPPAERGGGPDLAAQPVQPAHRLPPGLHQRGAAAAQRGSNVGFSNTGFTIPFRTNSLLARATYAYRDRYLATASVRRDCSSRFSPGNRCGTFGAGRSAGWSSEEALLPQHPRPRRGPTSSSCAASSACWATRTSATCATSRRSRRTSTTPTPARAAPAWLAGGATRRRSPTPTSAGSATGRPTWASTSASSTTRSPSRPTTTRTWPTRCS